MSPSATRKQSSEHAGPLIPLAVTSGRSLLQPQGTLLNGHNLLLAKLNDANAQAAMLADQVAALAAVNTTLRQRITELEAGG